MNLNLKQKRVIVAILTIILLGIIVGVSIYNKSEKNSSKLKNHKTYSKAEMIKKEASGENLSSVQKKILDADLDIDEDGSTPLEEIEEQQYTETYKEYLALPEEKKEEYEVVPRKQEINWVYLDTIKKTEEESFKKSDEGKKIEEQKKEETKKEENKKDEGKKDEDKNDETKKDELPSKFNLADKIKIDIRHQGTFGLCWDFASIKALETHLALKNHLNYDLSEIHLDYIESNLLYGYRQVHEGGNFSQFEDYLAISGVVLETAAPYRNHTPEEYNKFIDMENPVIVTETVQFPSVTKFIDENDTYTKRYTDEEIKEYREIVKKHIMSNGGLYCYIATPDPGSVYISDENNAEYCELGYSELPRGVHAMTIVGWDDNYSRNNFNSSMKPKNDGAYIAVNSWGTGYGNNGYYYISYEDRYVEEDMCGVVSTGEEGAYKIEAIRNPVLKQYLKDYYSNSFIKFNGEEYISKLVLSRIKNLDLSNTGLTSLEGIEMFPNLVSLNISNNKVKDISPLNNLNELWDLNLSNNEISDLSVLSLLHMEDINNFDLSNNKIEDVSVLVDLLKSDYINLNLSNNPGVRGYEKLSNVSMLNISGCDVKDISNLTGYKHLYCLDVSRNPGVVGFEYIPNSISSLYADSCGLTSIPDLPVASLNAIIDLKIADNSLSNLSGIEKFKNLNNLDISSNPIVDWSSLGLLEERVTMPYDWWEEDYAETYEIKIDANNINISDVCVFNEIKSKCYIELKGDNITDFSKMNSPKIVGLDLSDNIGIESYPNTPSLNTLIMKNCGITNLDNLPEYQEMSSIDLSNNNITNIDRLSSYKKLVNLSIADNKDLKGTISNAKLYLLNISNCGLKNGDLTINNNEIGFLNYGGNLDLDVKKIIDSSSSDFVSLHTDEMAYELYENLYNNPDRYIIIGSDVILVAKHPVNEEDIIDLSFMPDIKNIFMKRDHFYKIKITNGVLKKNRYAVEVINISKNSLKIDFEYENDVEIRFTEFGVAEETDQTEDIDTIQYENNKNEANNTNTIDNVNNMNSISNVNNTNITYNTNTTQNTNTINDNSINENEGYTEKVESTEKIQDITGEWKIHSAEQDGEEVALNTIFGSGVKYGGSIEIKKDGSYSKYIGVTSDEQKNELNGTYKYDGNTVTFTNYNGEVETAQITDDTLKLMNSDGYIIYFTKSE